MIKGWGNERKAMDFSQLSAQKGWGHLSLIYDYLGNYMLAPICSVQSLQ